ncbi:Bax inhibitor-1 family protein, partial [uncultured Veillonella sp.]|uniref:Bax inhibitor-1/YccA family protein n=1 Tax=uncultured Veillonella sp. TaxID=159268 RepID=UPI00261B4F40
MNPYNVTGPSNSQVAQVESIVSQRLKGSFLWMVVGLLTTIGVGVAALANPNWLHFAYENFNIILLVELGVVFLFSARAYTANVMTLKGMFFLYSALNGLTLTLISLRYNVFEVVIPALIGTLAFFLGFAVVGATTKRNLSSLTPYVMAALLGMIIVSQFCPAMTQIAIEQGVNLADYNAAGVSIVSFGVLCHPFIVGLFAAFWFQNYIAIAIIIVVYVVLY